MAEQEDRGRRYWAFQANPREFGVERALRDLTFDTWMTKRSDVRAGDRALIWKSLGGSRDRGIIAFAEVLGDPELRDPDSAYWERDRGHALEPHVPIRYVVPA